MEANEETLFSAHAEVIPQSPYFAAVIPSLLRACGGNSTISSQSSKAPGSSPRMRR